MADYDWTRFTLRINVDVAPEALYKAWVTRKGIESWFLRLSEYSRNDVLPGADDPVQQGDRYKWQWFGYPDSVVEYGKVLQANGKDFFEFTFGGPAGSPAASDGDGRLPGGARSARLRPGSCDRCAAPPWPPGRAHQRDDAEHGRASRRGR